MDAKEKAKEMVHVYTKELLRTNYKINGLVINNLAIQCALIAVEEILDARPVITYTQVEFINFWNDVKSELQSLWGVANIC